MIGTNDSLRLRSAISSHIVFGVFTWPLAIAFAYLGVTKTPSAWRVCALVVACAIFCHLYFAFLQLTISNGTLTYRTLFSRRSMALCDIVQSEIQRNVSRRDPRTFLAIDYANGGKTLRINLKPFRLDDIRRLLAVPELRLKKGVHLE